jgi:hypothetical protein
MRMKRKIVIRNQVGMTILFVYLLIVITLEFVRAFTGLPIIEWLASSPAGLGHGEWWRLVTSAFVIDGPALPQIAATALLGGLIIWFRGSWLFWGIAAAGHIFGTLFTYLGILLTGIGGVHAFHHFINAPDYGISLIWSAALGVVASAAWLGPDRTIGSVYRPILTLSAFLLMVLIIILSRGDEALQHAVAFAIGAILTAAFDRRGTISQGRAVRRAS